MSIHSCHIPTGEDRVIRLPRVRFTVRQMMVVVAALGIILTLARYVFIEDSPDQLLAGILHPHSTVYASGYNESRFRSIRIGMGTSQVERLVGSPLERRPAWWSPGDDLWLYTRGRTSTSRRRWVVFRNGKVVAVINDFYVD
jgi:hypothetical protein